MKTACERIREARKEAETEYRSQAARDARDRNYGGPRYWAYLDKACQESRDHWLEKGNPARAEEMMTRSLVESLRGNDGD